MDPFTFGLMVMAVGYFVTKGKVDTAAYASGKEPPGVTKARLRHEAGGGARTATGQPKGPGALGLLMASRWASACQSVQQRADHRAARRRAWYEETAPQRDEAWKAKQQLKMQRHDDARRRWADRQGLLDLTELRERRNQDRAGNENEARDQAAAAPNETDDNSARGNPSVSPDLASPGTVGSTSPGDTAVPAPDRSRGSGVPACSSCGRPMVRDGGLPARKHKADATVTVPLKCYHCDVTSEHTVPDPQPDSMANAVYDPPEPEPAPVVPDPAPAASPAAVSPWTPCPRCNGARFDANGDPCPSCKQVGKFPSWMFDPDRNLHAREDWLRVLNGDPPTDTDQADAETSSDTPAPTAAPETTPETPAADGDQTSVEATVESVDGSEPGSSHGRCVKCGTAMQAHGEPHIDEGDGSVMTSTTCPRCGVESCTFRAATDEEYLDAFGHAFDDDTEEPEHLDCASPASTSDVPEHITPEGSPTVYEQAVQDLIAAADQVGQYRTDLAQFGDGLDGKRWGAEVTGPIKDMDGELAETEATYRNLATSINDQGSRGAAAYDAAPWVPGPEAVLA